jgi:Skp family chaperone for outer membrane proteins
MKIRTIILSCLLAVPVLLCVHQYSRAQEPQSQYKVLTIGVVNVQQIFINSKTSKQYETQAMAERETILAELEKLSNEIETEKAGLKTLKTGSSDYMAVTKTILEKQASLQAQKQFQEQQLSLKYQQRIEGLYQRILRITGEIAKEKDLSLVMEKDEIEIPASNVDNLMLAIRTHKMLYSDIRLDITSEVMGRLDAEK